MKKTNASEKSEGGNLKIAASAARRAEDEYRAVPVLRVRKESERVNTFFFSRPPGFSAEPGQIVMLWIPRVDEKPFGVMTQNEREFAVSVASVGPFTKKLASLKKGALVGLRGPYGRGFELPAKAKKIACVGGGFGSAPLAFLAQRAHERGVKTIFFQGCQKASEVILEWRLREVGADLRVATDDGSRGFKGFCTQALEEEFAKQDFDAVFACGPEKMMVAVLKACRARSIPSQHCLERFMKCGFGVCGQCALNDKLVCKDGPVFNGGELAKLSDFGRVTRDASGKVQKL